VSLTGEVGALVKQHANTLGLTVEQLQTDYAARYKYNAWSWSLFAKEQIRRRQAPARFFPD
jgi:hypothetical protein